MNIGFLNVQPLYHILIDKDEKIFHHEGPPKRFTELHENRRGRKEIRGEQAKRKGDSRGKRQIYTVICSQSVLRSPDTHKDSPNWIGKRRGKEEIELF